MSKPAHWIVYVNGVPSEPFYCRARARGFALIRKAQGDEVRVEAKGY